MNYLCVVCEREDYWGKEDTWSYGDESNFPPFSTCPYCEEQICEICYDEHIEKEES